MGVNMIGFCISDEDVCCNASRDEIVRRHYYALCNLANKGNNENEVNKIALIMKQAKITTDYRRTTVAAQAKKNNRAYMQQLLNYTMAQSSRHAQVNFLDLARLSS